MSNANIDDMAKRIAALENEIAEAKAIQDDLQQQLEKARKRERIAVAAYKKERENSKESGTPSSGHPRIEPGNSLVFLNKIVSSIPDQMMIFTYHDGIEPTEMKYIWFKQPDPSGFVSSVLKHDPSGDFLSDHIDEKLLRQRCSLLKGIHDTKQPVEHAYSVPKVVLSNGKRIVQRGSGEWRKTTYVSFDGKSMVFAFVRDISSFKKATSAVKEKDRLKINLFENLKDMVFVSTPGGTLYDFNPASSDLLGYTASELMLIKVEDLYANPKQRAEVLKTINKQGFIKDYETIFRHKDGSEIPVTITATPLDLQGMGRVFQGVIRNISGIKRQEQLQGVLAIAGSVLHGFTQPLQTFSSLIGCMSGDLDEIVEGVGEALQAMIESNLEEKDIKRYAQKLYSILLEPADPDNPSLNRTQNDLKTMKDAYKKMTDLIQEIRGIERDTDLKKVHYADGSDIIELAGMGGFDAKSDE